MKKFLLTLAAILALAPPTTFAHSPDQAPRQIADLGELQLEGGGIINNLRMSYVTHGTLNEARDNAILIMHGFAANHHNADHFRTSN
jgi:homoserine O-acetyltransferase